MGVTELITIDEVRAAAAAIDGHVLRTPTVPSPGLSAALGVPTTAKLELLQRTGSFKPRGAFYRILGLDEAQRVAGVVAVSGGNHGIAVAEVARELGVAATIVMSASAPPGSVQRCRDAGAEVRLTDGMAAAFALLDELVARGRTLVHPFDDRDVVAAQGTVGLELVEDAPAVTDVFVSVGGGGLIAGVAAAVRALRPHVRVWGVETSGADAMSRALARGEVVETVPSSIVTTLSAPHVSRLTLAHVRDLVEDVLVVSDSAAVRGAVELAEVAKVWAEPAAGCLLPAARTVLGRLDGDVHPALVVCGGNVTWADIAGWLDGARSAHDLSDAMNRVDA